MKYTLTRTKITKVEKYITRSGYPSEYSYEDTILNTNIKTAKKGWELAEQDQKENNFNCTMAGIDPIGHVHYKYDVRKNT